MAVYSAAGVEIEPLEADVSFSPQNLWILRGPQKRENEKSIPFEQFVREEIKRDPKGSYSKGQNSKNKISQLGPTGSIERFFL